MANMYMKIGTHDGKGDATAKYAGDAGVSEGGWFAIRSFNWGAARSVGMDIGNGMNRDAGMVAMSEISVSKEMDGASENILSRMYVPGEQGDEVQIIVTKPARTGQGAEVYLQITLTNARIVNYSLSASDGATPFENLALAYSKMAVKHWHEEEGGNLVAGGDVTYDLPTGVAESHAISG
ncbi:type VI secretion system tube protein Hcp [Sansalvadorimonas sp. 2012CJ34-2]|uniref:Type VI secretion system tube protein Hcp n=1 Tax=Parendozoicomonas callyspongiae TaxID=2942213 RepID=A0ABT0PJB2_9GAMM|nr:type VI secretion system tube protein Hcp [Sansalvadorimonas sp. 2012CJ34-2]MCL6271439.1 type VI secretion system tube protein Hcp [Sansalvadorimonas sp. 2012CJ34-2]